jgi:hypothetical protein
MLPATGGQVMKARRWSQRERRWAWPRPVVGLAYGSPLAGVFGLPAD